MIDENVFMSRTIELINGSKTQRDGVGTRLVDEFSLPGKHSVTRLVDRLFGASISQMLKLRFEYPEDWVSRLPKSGLLKTTSLAERIDELRLMGKTFKESKDILMKEYKVSEMQLVTRVRSIKQKSLAEVFEPTNEEIQSALIRSADVDEFWQILGIDSHGRQGFFDKRLGVSNYRTAKATCLYKLKIPKILPCTADNESLIFSQVLGDGSYDKSRKTLRIVHGIKQLDYLRTKVSMLCNAYPQLYGIEKISVHTHAQGHEYCAWYSGRLPDHVTNKLESFDYLEMISNLTPLGMLWLYLDDGCLFWKETKSITISLGKDIEKHKILAEYLSTYNIHAVPYDKTCTIAQKVEINKFLNTFVKPYIDIVPECLRYKTEIMI